FRTSRTASKSFFEQIVLMIPRSASAMTMSRFSGQKVMPPSLRVPFQKVSSRSQMTSLTGSTESSLMYFPVPPREQGDLLSHSKVKSRLLAPAQVCIMTFHGMHSTVGCATSASNQQYHSRAA